MTLIEEFKAIVDKLVNPQLLNFDSVAFGYALAKGLSEEEADNFAREYYYHHQE